MADPWDQFPDAEADPWAAFPDATPAAPPPQAGRVARQAQFEPFMQGRPHRAMQFEPFMQGRPHRAMQFEPFMQGRPHRAMQFEPDMQSAPPAGQQIVPPMNMPPNPELALQGPGAGGGMQELFDMGILPRRYQESPFPAEDPAAPRVLRSEEVIQGAVRSVIGPYAGAGPMMDPVAATAQQTAPPPAAAGAAAVGPRPQGFLQTADGLGAALFDGIRQGGAMLLGAPVDLVNNAPRLANLLPGVEGVGPMTDRPFGGRDSIDTGVRTASGFLAEPALSSIDSLLGTNLAGGFERNSLGVPVVPDYQPQTGPERIINRMGEEVGATMVPVGAAVGIGRHIPIQTVNRMAATPQTVGQGIAAQFLQPAAVNPVGLAGREAYYAGAAGLGAGIANEAAGERQGVVSDLLGSLAGVGAGAATAGLAGAAGNVLAGATGRPGFVDDVAGSAVAERLINSSTQMQEQAARFTEAGIPTSQIDTDPLVQALRSQADVERAVPGYRANIADRTRDPGLATLAYNTDALSPGAATARRVGNETAVNERMAGFTPDGDPARFRANLQAGVDQQIAGATGAVDQARTVFDDVVQALQPIMREASARGSSIRSALADAYSAAQRRVESLYAPINQADVPVDIAPLRQTFGSIDDSLPLNDRLRFRPTEANIPDRLAPEAPADPVPTGILDASGRPVMRQPDMPDSTVPLREVTAMRSGLTDDVRAQRAAGQNQAARVGGQYIDAIDEFTDANIPEGLRAALDEARAARRDVGERFERPGTALEDILSRREGGGFAVDDSAVPSRIAQPDQGRLSDLRAALREAGSDVRLRDGLADEVRSDVTRRGLLERPAALGKYMADRQVLLGEFPELRAQLEQAGASRATLAEAERVAKETTTRLTTPGRSAEATYLSKSVEDAGQSIRAVIASRDPRQAVADLVATANSPQAKIDLRAALWEEVKRSGRLQADGVTGETRWNGKKLRALFDDPKFASVAEELWADDPQDLTNIRQVFDALAGAEGSTRARAPNTSGTAQSLTGRYDAALTASSVASRIGSVNRGQMLPSIAAIDLIGTYLRRRSAQVQSRAIDAITASVVNNPGLAADLLEKYNPATAAARRRMLTQKYGVRATTLLNIMDEAENEDPVVEALQE